MSIELVVFDWDGTLMDSEQKIVGCFDQAFLDLGLAKPPGGAARSTIGLSLSEAMRVSLPNPTTGLVQALVERYRYRYRSSVSVNATVLFPGTLPVFEALESKQLWLAVATGKSSAGLKRDLQASGLARYFHSTRCADQANSKPHPQMLEDIMADLNVDKHNTVMVGDTGFDMEMAKNAGTHAVAVTYGAHSVERLLEFSPHATLDRLGDLPALLDTFD